MIYALRQISKRPDVLPWLVLVVSNLGALLMYAFVKDLFGDRRVAVYCVDPLLVRTRQAVFLSADEHHHACCCSRLHLSGIAVDVELALGVCGAARHRACIGSCSMSPSRLPSELSWRR